MNDIEGVGAELEARSRPMFIWGAGVRGHEKLALRVAEDMNIPVAVTWGAIDLIRHDHPLFAGGFGTHGNRAANFAIQNSDCICSLGCRLDTKATGHPEHFAREALIYMVDQDQAEIDKMEKVGVTLQAGLCMDVGAFLTELNEYTFKLRSHSWKYQIQKWRSMWDDPVVDWPGVNPYQLMRDIAKYTTKDDIIVSDTGTAIGYVCKAFPFKGERMLHAWNQTPMGYGIPAAIGASFATTRRVILITGDGSALMSLSDLALIARWNLNIKIILLNNNGHAMCRQTQRQWLDGNYYSTSVDGGLPDLDFDELAHAFGIVGLGEDCATLEQLFSSDGRGFLQVFIHPDAQLIPQCKFGQPLEDPDPQLDREEFVHEMIVSPLS
jgi:acetolactate synthase-1/2/3 large subunit